MERLLAGTKPGEQRGQMIEQLEVHGLTTGLARCAGDG